MARLPELPDLHCLAFDLLDVAPEDCHRPAVGRETLAFLQYTSGSTSTPKGVLVSHGNLLHNEETIRQTFGQSERSVVVGATY